MVATDEPISGSTPTNAPKPRAFASSELVTCNACSRANPPTRASCLYCGAALEITNLNAFSPAPDQEAATGDVCFHVAIASAQVDEATIEKLAELLDRKVSDLQLLLAQSGGAPLFAVNSEKQAQAVAEKLHELGIATRVTSDEQLTVHTMPLAVSALEIRDDALVGTVGRSKSAVPVFWDQIKLIVIGRLYFETKEIEQKRSRAHQVVDEREILTDEAVLDIYARHDEVGWRISVNSFDFSCLGDKKQLTAFANFAALIAMLRERATAAVLDDSYVRLRNALDAVWPAEPNARAKERRRTAFRDFDSSVTSIDNELQFTRYSRLLSYLHEANSEGHAAQT